VRVAVDAMGGDHAPRELVAGALEAVRADEALTVLLVGPEDRLRAELAEAGDGSAAGGPDRVSIVHAGDVIGMDAKPVEALRAHPDASILRAMGLVAKGEADGVVAAGSTGAAVAAATLSLKRLPGVRRPGIAVPLPASNEKGVCLLIDAGANPNGRAHHLAQYAVMGANFYREVYGLDDPRVGLVSIGEEETKGIHLTRDAAQLLRADEQVRFIGNIEGRGLFGGACEVAVADGFVGNIILKSAEGLAEMLLGTLKSMLGSSGDSDRLRQFDYAENGGAPMLGVDGAVMICHGRSDRRAIRNAVLNCARAIDHHVNDKIVAGLGGTREAGA